MNNKIRKAFIKDVNKALAPIGEMIQTRTGGIEAFEIVLRKNPYFMVDHININNACTQMITKYGMKHFKEEPGFNNTRRCFWFFIA